MPTQNGAFELTFRAGLDTKTADRLLPNQEGFLELVNCVQSRTGRLEKISGFVDIDTSGAADQINYTGYGGASRDSIYRIGEYRGAVCVASAPGASSIGGFSVYDSVTDTWMAAGNVSPCLVSERTALSVGEAGIVTLSAARTDGGVRIVAAVNQTTNEIFYRLEDDDGTTITPTQTIGHTDGTFRIRCVAAGPFIYLLWEAAGAHISGVVMDTSASPYVFGAEQVFVAGDVHADSIWDAWGNVGGSGEIVIAYKRFLSGFVGVRRTDELATSIASATISEIVKTDIGANGLGTQEIYIAWDSTIPFAGDEIRCAAYTDSDGSLPVKFAAVTIDSVSSDETLVAIATLAHSVSAGMVVWSTSDDTNEARVTRRSKVSDTGGTLGTFIHANRSSTIASRPFAYSAGGRVYMLASYDDYEMTGGGELDALQRHTYLTDLLAEASTDDVVHTFVPVAHLYAHGSARAVIGCCATTPVTDASASKWTVYQRQLVRRQVVAGGGGNALTYVVAAYTFDFGALQKTRFVDVGDVLVTTGAVTLAYDGNRYAELGFFHDPYFTVAEALV